MDQHYHPIIYQRLTGLFDACDWDALQSYLDGLSNAHFRTAGYLIGERLMPAAERDDFWELMRRLILWQPRAFTVTTGKAALLRLKRGTLSFEDAGFQELVAVLSAPDRIIDRQKLLLLWLPAIEEPQTMEQLFAQFGINERRRADFLLHTEGMVAAFVLLRALCYEEHDRDFLITTCRQVMKRGDNLSFNLASLLRTYFDLPEVKGTFSLALQPYELSRLDTDFDVFSRVMTKV